ncbi:MAG TPA: hypothetical protein VG432_12065 [Gemmatimonadaceae bacterium]|nr:hypothetical protein [Gemmatimonadaceae bacterium]
MPKATPTFDLESYTPVAERIRRFYERYPSGRIVTELVSREPQEGANVITFRALAYRATGDELPAATGWAAERDDDGEINAVACLENAETSAIGRALANLGFATSTRPSREEMEKANRACARRGEGRAAPNGRPVGAIVAARQVPRGYAGRDTVLEVLSLADEIERTDADPGRVRRLRRRLEHTRPTLASLHRVERLLRRWLISLDSSSRGEP